MLPGPGRTSGNVDSAANRTPRRIFRRSKEKMNPHNIEFQRRVAALQARQEERSKMLAILNLSPAEVYLALSVLSHQTLEDVLGQASSQSTDSTAIIDGLEPSDSSSPIFIRVVIPEESHIRCLIDSSRPSETLSPVPHKVPDSDFLNNTFFKTSANAKQATRNKNKRKNKKNKRHGRKEPSAHEMHENHEADVLFEATPSPRTQANEVSMERPDCEIGQSTPSSTNELELTRPTTSYFQFCEQSGSNNFKWLESSKNDCYTGNSWNFGVGIENLLIGKNEFPRAPSKLTDSGGFRSGGGKSWKSVCFENGTGACSNTQQVQLCSNASDVDDFQLVISRKRAQKTKKMHFFRYSSGSMASSSRPSNVFKQPQDGATSKDFIRDFTHKSSKTQTRVPHEVTLQDYIRGIDIDCFSGPREKGRGKSQKGPNLSEVATKGGFTEDNNVGRAKMLHGTMHPGKSDNSQMAPRSASHLVAQNDLEDKCTSGHRPTQGELKVFLSGDGDAIYRDSRSPSPAMTLSLDYMEISSCVEQKGQKKVDKTVSSKHRRAQGDQHAEAHSSLSHAHAADQWKTPRPSEADLDDVCLALPTVKGNNNANKQIVGRASFDLTEIVKAANEAYKIQVASDEQLISGQPTADIETFIYSATPVIGQISCIRCGNCLQDRPVSESTCQYQISNVYLRSVWEWYEEPGSFGLNVEINNSLSPTELTCSGSDFSANFVPLLSAIQLFGQSKKNLDGVFDKQEEASLFEQDHAELLFEYFESEHPSSRPPLLAKIKQLVSDANISGTHVFGDPKELENVKLSDLHPASWFCVAWYPIYRIPQGNCHAAFLTYHSLGKFVPQTCTPDMADGHTHVVSPVVGLWSYNDKGEHWFQRRDAGLKTVSSDDSSKTDRAEALKERLRTLRRGASVISRAVIPKATGETINHHPDYEFFRSRSN